MSGILTRERERVGEATIACCNQVEVFSCRLHGVRPQPQGPPWTEALVLLCPDESHGDLHQTTLPVLPGDAVTLHTQCLTLQCLDKPACHTNQLLNIYVLHHQLCKVDSTWRIYETRSPHTSICLSHKHRRWRVLRGTKCYKKTAWFQLFVSSL